MSTEITVPALGESVLEATVSEWLKVEGEAVAAGDIVVRLETDKVDLEVSAERGGVLARIIKGPGEDVQVGDVLGIVADAGEEPEAGSRKPEAGGRKLEAGHAVEATGPAGEEARATPLARRVAEDQGVDLSTVKGSGPGGRVTREDVEARVREAAPQPAAPPLQPPASSFQPPAPSPQPPASSFQLPASGRPETRTRLSRRRQTIARRLVEAQQTAAMLTTFNEVDMSAVMEVRSRRKESFKEQHGIGLGFMSFFVKASIGALKAFPQINAELQGDELILKGYYDIGIAIGAEEGLVVPVLRDADRLSFAGIEQAIADLAAKSRAGALTLDDLRGGTFTITNGGVFGSLLSTPILNPPQVGILGMHKIEQRPVALDGQVVIRPMMYVALSYDHRIVDGREAVQFLVRLKQLIEDPELLLLEG
ncbi:MAG: Dihydrolipoyllysine-residue succinyltransferase component of 2-oxoglutarate dehydrogenase complex [Chloroflexi bacterium ADurb.Bin325]|nr:MAG: Dihydrolipoyllysine-residue succinyltransferase component of 2-oxoglutarate dehydrogenase complex [Chloroflexi bacterium ADurb.Bin325]